MLERQFSVLSVEELSCGRVEKMVTDSRSCLPTTHVHPLISYTLPLTVNDHPDKDKALQPTQHGFLGPQSAKDAYQRLHKAPLLADLSDWMQWDIVFAPSLGPLADFLMKQDESGLVEHAGFIHALQDSTGKLLKIDPMSTRKKFVAALEAFDPVDAAGHLVSMAVNQTSVHLMSTQLLAKNVVTKLEQVESQKRNSLLPENFVFHCLQRIPLELCESLGKQVSIVICSLIDFFSINECT